MPCLRNVSKYLLIYRRTQLQKEGSFSVKALPSYLYQIFVSQLFTIMNHHESKLIIVSYRYAIEDSSSEFEFIQRNSET